MKLHVIVVDDEPLARERLCRLLADIPEIEVVARCASAEAALAAVDRFRPDVLFLDVRMPGLDGFQLVERLNGSLRPEVVFVTAYDHYALGAFEVAAADYLLKPVDPERLRETVARLVDRLRQRAESTLASEVTRLLEKLRPSEPARESRLVARGDGRILLVRPEEVDSFEADGNYVRLHCGTRALRMRGTMAQLEERLDPRRFVRVHRSWMVNVDQVVELEPFFHGGYVLRLKGGRRITTGRGYRDRVDALLDTA